MIELTNSEFHTGLLRKAWKHQQTRFILLVTLTTYCSKVDSSNTTDLHKYRVRQRAGSSSVLILHNLLMIYIQCAKHSIISLPKFALMLKEECDSRNALLQGKSSRASKRIVISFQGHWQYHGSCEATPVRATVGLEVGDLSEHVGSSEVTLT
jgi:hypothetical protein